MAFTFNPFTGTLDRTNTFGVNSANSLYLRLDTANNPLVGDIMLSKASASIRTTNNQNLYLVPNGTGFTVVGDSGATNHTLDSNDDLYVNGELEVDGTIFPDGTISQTYSAINISGANTGGSGLRTSFTSAFNQNQNSWYTQCINTYSSGTRTTRLSAIETDLQNQAQQTMNNLFGMYTSVTPNANNSTIVNSSFQTGRLNIQNRSGMAMTNFHAYSFDTVNSNLATGGNTMTLTNFAMLYMPFVSAPSGLTITNKYGVRIEDPLAQNVLNSITTTSNANLDIVPNGNGTIQLSGGQFVKRTSIANANYTALKTDYIIAYTSLASTRTVTLPLASLASLSSVPMLVVKDETGLASTYPITIDGNGSETIDGQTTYTINTDYGQVEVYSNGTAWFTK